MSLKQKISQMFITGFSGDFKENDYFVDLLKNGLGGVIFFTHNIENEFQFRKLICDIKERAFIPLFYSIDQEGGRVERTENIHCGKKYLSAKFAFKKGETFLAEQTSLIAKELKSYGINMNFAPVLDVNTNDKNPIIGERAYSSDTEEVIRASKIVLKEYKKENIITVGKHFPGHGDASADSHKTLPVIDLSYEELETKHIKPFKIAIEEGIPCIMAAHVVYPSFDKKLPASVSDVFIKDLLINKLNFNGVIMTDDMEMNGIKGLSRFEACKRAINAGISMFIFRDTTEEIYNLINNLESAVKTGEIKEENIDSSVKKIIDLKQDYKIIAD